MASITRRLEKVEEAVGGRGGCPECWSWPINWQQTTVIVEGDKEAEIPTCPRCGRQPENVLIRRYNVDLEAV